MALHCTSAGARIGYWLLVTLAAGFCTATWAQIGEIVVLTRKRAENLQDVPIAVDAITSEQIEQKGIVSLDRVLAQSPSLILDKGFAPQDTRIVIRGLAPTRGRQNVAVLEDGIDVSSEAIGTAGGSLLINPRLFDLERVEIVKGPQNALYGRSAFAGAINYITRKPGEEFTGSVGVDIGSQAQREVRATVSGPLTGTLSAGFAGMLWTNDGFYHNYFTTGDMGGSTGGTLSTTLVWKPVAAVSVTGRAEYLNDSFGITQFGVPRFTNGVVVRDPAASPFNQQFPIPPASQVPVAIDTDGNPATPPVNRSVVAATSFGQPLTSVAGFDGNVPGADNIIPMMSEDPKQCDETRPVTGQQGCGDYGGTDRAIARGTMTIGWDAGPVQFTSLTHYAVTSIQTLEGSKDVTASTATAAGEVRFRNNTNLISQEFRVQSNGTGPLSWTAGTLYWEEDTKFLDGSYTCLNYAALAPFLGLPPALTPPPNIPTNCGSTMAQIGNGLATPVNTDTWLRDTTHWSVYGLVDWRIIDQLNVIAEARYTREHLNVAGPGYPSPFQDNSIYDPSGVLCPLLANNFSGLVPLCPANGPTPASIPVPGSSNDSFFAPKLTLQGRPTDNQMYYFSIAEAFKPKGISLIGGGAGAFNVDDSRFDQEKLINYELGAKTLWLDRTLQLNGALFYEDFKNKQVSTQVADPNTGILRARISNAGKARVYGVELDLAWRPTENLTTNLDYTYLDTKYTDFNVLTTGIGTIAYGGNCTEIVATAKPTNVGGDTQGKQSLRCEVSYNGNRLENAPKHSLVGGARYQRPLAGSTNWFVGGDFRFQDDRFANQDNRMVFPSYWLFDFTAGLSAARWDALFYINNAFDDDTVKTGFADGDIPTFQQTGRFLNHATVTLPDRRSFGLRMAYRFGAGPR